MLQYQNILSNTTNKQKTRVCVKYEENTYLTLSFRDTHPRKGLSAEVPLATWQVIWRWWYVQRVKTVDPFELSFACFTNKIHVSSQYKLTSILLFNHSLSLTAHI